MAFSTGFIRLTRASMPGSGKSHIKTFSSFSAARIRSRSPSTAGRPRARLPSAPDSPPSSPGAVMPTHERHLVSICIPMFDAGRFLLDAIASARAQTYQDVEIIIVDNYSRDGSFELAEEAARADPRIRLHRNDQNVGMQRNFGRCLELARGDRKSTRLNSSHVAISYAVFCLKKKNTATKPTQCKKENKKRNINK